MSSLPANNTPVKRRLIREDPEEDIFVFMNQRSENSSEIQPASVIVPPEEAPKKARRGRPPKRTAPVTRSVAEASTSANATIPAIASTNLPEFDLVLEAMSLKVRPSTAAIYRKPMEDWQDFCRKNRHRYPVDPQFPLTVGPTEFVLAFFKEFVMKRTYKKCVSMDTDVRTQIALRSDENENSGLTLLEIAENAPVNKRGGKRVIDVPLGIEAVNQYKKVLMLIYDYQFEHRAIPWPSPKKTTELLGLIKKYERDLVYDQVQTNADRAAHCVIRDSYKSGELITMLKNLWVSKGDTGLREMFSISSRHHMLLRAQDLRNLNFADCFCTIVPKKQHKGMQQALCLVFSLDKGKTLKEGEVKFACAIRHENVFRCPFGAFAFYMFSMLQKSGDFLKEDRWHNWKVVPGRDDPEKSLSGVAQWKSTKKALTDEAIHTTRVTHGGRHAGAMEAEGLGIPFDLIKRGGGWKDRLGRLETHYLGKLPSSFARGMAGFWEKPFSLPRNSVSPPLELQRMVFPWIESYYGEGNLEWQTVCDKEMKEFDENEDEEANILNLEVEKEAEPIEFVEEDGRMVQKKQKGKGKQKAISSVDTAKRGFLRLLIRCRRIVLQDAAVYLYFDKHNKHVSPSSTIFSSYIFKMFQEDVIAAINSPTIGRLEEYEGLVPNIVDTSKQMATRIAEVNHRVIRLQQHQERRFEMNENSFNNYILQNAQQNALNFQINQQLAKDVKIIMMQQQCLNAQMQLLMATNNAHQDPSINTSLSQPPTFHPMLPFSFPTPPQASQPPIAISPAPQQLNNTSSNNNTSPAPRPKKKTRWVSYEPSSSD